MVNDHVWHWELIPRIPCDPFTGSKAHKIEASLLVSTRSHTNGCPRARGLPVTGLVLFVHLAVLAKLECQVLLVIQGLSRQNSSRTVDGRNSSFGGKVVNHSPARKYKVSQQQFENSSVGQTMSHSPASFLNHANSPFNLWHVLTRTGQIDARCPSHFTNAG